MRTQRGWTLIELAIVVAVAGILLGITLPSLAGALEGSRALSVRNDFIASLTLASNRAALMGTRVVLCPGTSAYGCNDSADLSQGWLVFTDPNASREFEGGESVLREQPPLPGKVRLRSTSGRLRIVFQGNGGNAGSNATFTLCDGRGPRRAVSLVLANNGRLRDGDATAANISATCAP